MSDKSSLSRRASAEALGTALLLLAVVGSGIAASRLTDDAAVTLLVHALVTGLGLAAAVIAFGPVSGAHLNPAVTLSVTIEHGLPWAELPVYVAAQLVGGVVGVVAANVMFDVPALSIAETARSAPALWLSEFIATFGLLAVIFGAVRLHTGATVAAVVGAYIAAAIWFTSSGAFANPAVTIARTLTDTYAGIAPLDALSFIAAQVAGAVVATFAFRWLIPSLPRHAEEAVIPRDRSSIER